MALWKEQPNNYNDRKQQKPKLPTDCILIANASDKLKERFKRSCGNKDATLFLIELLDVFDNFEGR